MIDDPNSRQNERDARVVEAIEHEGPRIRGFLRRRLGRDSDVEDLLQDVFSSLVEASRIEPIEQVGAWLFRAARNRLVDFFRKRRPEALPGTELRAEGAGGEGEEARLVDLLPSLDAGPEAAYARRVLAEALADAIDDLPPDQRAVLVAHEIEGRSFREIAETTGIGINTLLSRKRYAVLRLRRTLETVYEELTNE